jgi:tRNA A-37 threonylcarbamoyl transferase component Bud32
MTISLRCEHCATELASDALFCPMCGSPRLRPDGDSLIGQVIADRYLLRSRVGHGASGNIYQAEHVTLRRKVAIKILHHELSRDDLSIERFRREATTVGQIDNEHIVEVVDFGRMPDGRLFLAMEWLDGETLRDALERESRLPITKVVDVLVQLGEALMEAHAMGYIHRDLRPRNVFLARRRGQDGYVKLLDFGLAKLVEREGEAASTSLGMTFGDPHYMSPEQAHGDPVDRRGDIYSLGCMAFHMLTGSPPFSGERVFDVLTKHLETSPPSPSSLRPDVPAWLDAVVLRMLAKRADQRFVTVYRLVEALKEGERTGAIMADAVARKDSTVPPPAPAPRSRETDVVRVMSPDEIRRHAGADTPIGQSGSTGTLPDGRGGVAAGGGASGAAAGRAGDGAAAAGGDGAQRDESSGMSGMWFADGEAIDEDAKRSRKGDKAGGGGGGKARAPRRGENGASRPSWSQEVVYADDDRRRKLLLIGGLFAAVIIIVMAIVLWPKGKKSELSSALAGPADAGVADATPPPAIVDASIAPLGPPDASTRPGRPVRDPGPRDPGPRDPGPRDPGPRDPGPRGTGPDTREAERLLGLGNPLPDSGGAGDPGEGADAAQAEFYVKLGRQALARGDSTGAQTNFNKAREFDRRNADAIAGLGEVAMQQGAYTDAVVHLDAAARLAPRSARIWTLLGQAYLGADRKPDAQSAFKRALKIDPSSEAARRGLDQASN